MPPSAPGDERTVSQRRHDAFEDLARSYLDGAATPEAGGERAHLNLVVDVEALEGIPGAIHETIDGQVIDMDTIRQLACDCTTTRVVWDPPSEILDVGRRTRRIPASMRRAVVIRDRGCVWKGCQRFQQWCDVHHLRSWIDGGETKVSNLVLLCRYHHSLVHRHEGDIDEVLDLDHLRVTAVVRST
jgi:hypothetical protein